VLDQRHGVTFRNNTVMRSSSLALAAIIK
jgi:hypothetical protein